MLSLCIPLGLVLSPLTCHCSRESRFYLDPRTPLEEVRKELRSQCALKAESLFNLKWLDVDGDPISVDCPREWDEAIRLYMYNQETELLLHGEWAGQGWAC